MPTSPSPLMARTKKSVLWAALCGLAFGCDGSQRGRDASAPLSHRMAEISIRIDAPAGGNPSLSFLAYKAATGGIAAADVLAVVDPLVAARPESHCELRDVAGPARALDAQGGTVELEELGRVEVSPGTGSVLRAVPRVYPQLTSAVGGVIGEAGPINMEIFPDELTVALSTRRGPTEEPQWSVSTLQVPEMPMLVADDGTPLAAGTKLDAGSDVTLNLRGPARSFVELRPFGAPMVIACPMGVSGRITVPHELVQRLRAVSGRVPVSFEAVFRETGFAALSGQPTRLSLEARSSTVLELRP